MFVGDVVESLNKDEPPEFMQQIIQDADLQCSALTENLISQVIQQPNLMWKRDFVSKFFEFPKKQITAIVDWFNEMNKVTHLLIPLINCVDKLFSLGSTSIYQ